MTPRKLLLLATAAGLVALSGVGHSQPPAAPAPRPTAPDIVFHYQERPPAEVRQKEYERIARELSSEQLLDLLSGIQQERAELDRKEATFLAALKGKVVAREAGKGR